MNFESRILAFADRFLSGRSFRLIVEPALADLQFDPGARPLTQAVNRLAVLKAVAGGLRDDLARASGGFIALTLLPACYYICLLAICFDYFQTWRGFLSMVALIVVLSASPVLVCFWPERRSRPAE